MEECITSPLRRTGLLVYTCNSRAVARPLCLQGPAVGVVLHDHRVGITNLLCNYGHLLYCHSMVV